jgi:hypothetical protein
MTVMTAWLKLSLEGVSDPRWPAIGLKLGVNASLVVATVTAMISHAAQQQHPGSVADFDVFGLAAYLGIEDGPIRKIVKELEARKLIVNGVLVTGALWAPYVGSTERNRRLRQQKASSGRRDASTEGIGKKAPDGVAEAPRRKPPHEQAGEGRAGVELLDRLVEAAHGNIRCDADGNPVAGIRDLTIIHRLMKGGADLELDILPSITATVAIPGQPSIPTWDIPWIIDEIRRAIQARGEPDPLPPRPRAAAPSLEPTSFYRPAPPQPRPDDVWPDRDRGVQAPQPRPTRSQQALPSAVTIDRDGTVTHNGPPPGIKRLDGVVVDTDQHRPRGQHAWERELYGDGLAGAARDADAPAQIGSAGVLDEIVAGYAAGNMNWDHRRWGPAPGQPGCRVPVKILRENGY